MYFFFLQLGENRGYFYGNWKTEKESQYNSIL